MYIYSEMILAGKILPFCLFYTGLFSLCVSPAVPDTGKEQGSKVWEASLRDVDAR